MLAGKEWQRNRGARRDRYEIGQKHRSRTGWNDKRWLKKIFRVLPTGIAMGRKRNALMIVFAGNAQKTAGNVMVFNGFLLPLAVGAKNHFMAVVMMGEYGMHQHHDTGESDGGTCNLTVHHRVALIFTAQFYVYAGAKIMVLSVQSGCKRDCREIFAHIFRQILKHFSCLTYKYMRFCRKGASVPCESAYLKRQQS